MYITWHGQNCFKIQSKDVTLITDPIAKKDGLKPVRFTSANIIVQTAINEEVKNLGAETLVIQGPGEYEKKQVFIHGVGVDGTGLTAYLIEMEGITMGLLGPLNALLTEKQLEKLEGVDIIFVPIGGHKVLDAEKAAKIISQIEPRIAIPTNYQIPGLKENLDGLDAFVKEMGLKSAEKTDRLKIQKKDLPQDDMKVVILQNQ